MLTYLTFGDALESAVQVDHVVVLPGIIKENLIDVQLIRFLCSKRMGTLNGVAEVALKGIVK
jgi:hypothetical protein